MHTIRLRGPWEICDANGAAQPRQRIKLPATWKNAWEDFLGTAQLSRRFGCPSGLEPGDRVFLVIDASQPLERVALAGRSLAPPPPTSGVVRYDITPLLHTQNEVVVELKRRPSDARDADAERVLGEVWLEIEAND